MFWTCLVNLNQFWVVLASYVPFRSLYQIVFCSVLFWEKFWTLNLFMNEIADKWGFTRQQIFSFTRLHSNGNSLQQQFWVQAQGVMFFSLNREIERISCILYHRLTRSQTRLQTQDSDSSDMSLPETGVVLVAKCIFMPLQWQWKMFTNTWGNKWLKMKWCLKRRIWTVN